MINARHESEQLKEIRQSTAARDGAVPFLLLPVRLETRFKTVPKFRRAEAASPVAEIMERFGELQAATYEKLLPASGRSKPAVARRLTQRAKELRNEVEMLPLDEPADQHYLYRLVEGLEQCVAETTVGMTSRTQAQTKKALEAEVKGLRKVVKEKIVVTKPATWTASQYIKRSKKLLREVTVLSKGKIPFVSTTKKKGRKRKTKKKQLYQYLEGVADRLFQYYREYDEKLSSVTVIRKNQVARLREIHENIGRTVPGLIEALRRVHARDKNFQRFVNELNARLRERLPRGREHYERVVLPRLDQLAKVPRVSANELYHQGVLAGVKLARLKAVLSTKGSVTQIAKARRDLATQMASIAQQKTRVLEAKPSDLQRLDSMWTTLNDRAKSVKVTVEQLPKRGTPVGRSRLATEELLRHAGTVPTATVQPNSGPVVIGNQPMATRELHAAVVHAGAETRILTGMEIRDAADFTALFTANITTIKSVATGSGGVEETKRMIGGLLTQAQTATTKGMALTQVQSRELSEGLNTLKATVRAGALRDDREVQRQLAAASTLLKGNHPATTTARGAFELPDTINTSVELSHELWVRIYPDDIHVHTLEEQLSERENEDGQRFWEAWWVASGEETLQRGAWRALTVAYGTNRAAYIAHALDPRKLRENRSVLKLRMESNVQQATEAIDELVKELEPLNRTKGAKKNRANTDAKALNSAFRSITRRLSRVEGTQPLFHQRLLESVRQLEAKLAIIQEAFTDLPARPSANLQRQLGEVNTAFATYGRLQVIIRKVQLLPTQAFIDGLPERLTFPRLRLRKKDWTQTPCSYILPDRFVVAGKTGDEYDFLEVGKPVPKDLALGLNPDNFDFTDDDDNPFDLDALTGPQVEEGMKWMIDFHEAERVGMALRIPLTDDQMENGFDRVYAIGVRDETATAGAKSLEKLLQNHRFSEDGMALLRIGTPTNNTEAAAAGYRSDLDDAERSYARELAEPAFDVRDRGDYTRADGQRLGEALGIGSEPFLRIVGAGHPGISRATATHRSLWNATLGAFMDSYLDGVFTHDNIDRAEAFFSEHVYGRGGLPSLRVGTQPYGILPTTAFSQFRFHRTFDAANLPALTEEQAANPTAAQENTLQLRFDIRLHQMLEIMNTYWTELREEKVEWSGKPVAREDGGDETTLAGPQQRYLTMLGLQANSAEYYFRYGVNIAARGAQVIVGSAAGGGTKEINVNFSQEATYSPSALRALFRPLLDAGLFASSFEMIDAPDPADSDEQDRADYLSNRAMNRIQSSEIFRMRFFTEHGMLAGDLITSDGPGPGATLSTSATGEEIDSYINWLLNQPTIIELVGHNDFDQSRDNPQLPSRALLFMLLRSSLLHSYQRAGLNMLAHEGFFGRVFQKSIGNSSNYANITFGETGTGLRTFLYTNKWTYLFKRLSAFRGVEGLEFKLNGPDATAHDSGLYRYLEQNAATMDDFLMNKGRLFDRYQNSDALRPVLTKVDRLKEAMETLNTVPVDDLRELMAEHIDVSSYRLDAWRLGLVNRRLAEQRREGRKKGIHLGAYGWLMNLRPGGKREEVTDLPTELNSPDGTPVYTDADNEGYIHAPSLNQAITAAVLRSGYRAGQASISDVNNQLAVNLSSRRVRKALGVIEGVRNGQTLGAVLGYQFERGLHEAYKEVELDQYIYALRRAFPLVVNVDDAVSTGLEDFPANVVDGLAMLETIETHIEAIDPTPEGTIFGIINGQAVSDWPGFINTAVEGGAVSTATRQDVRRAILREIDRLGDTLDALGDLVVSESVYQVVQGNHVRAAAVVEAMAAGRALPDLQFIRTPRTGVVVTHRAVLNFTPVPAATAKGPNHWPQALSPRAALEPSLNTYLATMLGRAKDICCIAHFTAPASAPQERLISAFDLGLQPLDLLHLIGHTPGAAGSELEARIAEHIWTAEGRDASVDQIEFAQRRATWPQSRKTILEIAPLVNHLRAMLAGKKFVDARDLTLPPDEIALDNPERLDVAELQGRIAGALANYRKLAGDLSNFVTDHEPADVADPVIFTPAERAEAVALLTQIAPYRHPEAYGEAGTTPPGDEVVMSRLTSVDAAAQKRLGELPDLEEALAAKQSARAQVQLLRDVAVTLFSRDVLVYPHYELNTGAITTQLRLSKTKSLLRDLEVETTMADYVAELAEVRPGMYHLDTCNLLAEVLGTSAPAARPAQFPHVEGDYWLGLEYPDSFKPEGDYLSLILLNDAALTNGTGTRVGVIVDEWTEIIPNREETTGIAFHYDQPDAEPPQNILLAVNPDLKRRWTWDTLVHTLDETLELAMNRAVEPEHLEDSIFAQALPTTLGSVVPQDYRERSAPDANIPADGDELDWRNPLGVTVGMDFADNINQEES